LAAALLIAIGIPTWNRQSYFKNNATVSDLQQGDSEARIAQDNDLLRSVNVAISQGEKPSIDEYNLLEAPHSRSRARPESRKR